MSQVKRAECVAVKCRESEEANGAILPSLTQPCNWIAERRRRLVDQIRHRNDNELKASTAASIQATSLSTDFMETIA
jgi:hypothetical protein